LVIILIAGKKSSGPITLLGIQFILKPLPMIWMKPVLLPGRLAGCRVRDLIYAISLYSTEPMHTGCRVRDLIYAISLYSTEPMHNRERLRRLCVVIEFPM